MIKTNSLLKKRIFLIASHDQEKTAFLASAIERHIFEPTIFIAHDGSDAWFKIQNVPPHVAIIDQNLTKTDTEKLTEDILKKHKNTAVIFPFNIPEKEIFVDEVVKGKVQFLENFNSEEDVIETITLALNKISSLENCRYPLHFFPPNHILMNQDDIGKSAYLVKRGELIAYKSTDEGITELGEVHVGEFVGEMSHLNHQPRSATIKTITDCELIEIPFGTLDSLLFTKPSWAKALFATLSKRLKVSNEKL